MGRPRTDRSRQRVVRLSVEEDAQIMAQATELGLTAAAFLRLSALKKLPRRKGVIEPETAREIWRQVSGVARNVNQLTKIANAGKLKADEVERLTEEVRGLVRWAMEVARR